MKIYEYMVVFNFPNGTGRVEIKRERPIKSYEDIIELDKFISKNNDIKDLFVTNFKLLRVYDGAI